MLSIIGLLIIAVAWYFQLRTPGKVSKPFIGLYALGSLLLVINALGYDTILIAFLNFIIFLLAGWAFLKTSPKLPSKKSRRR